MKPRLLIEALAARNDSGLGRHVRLIAQGLAQAQVFDTHLLWPHDGPFEPPVGVKVHRVHPRPMRLWIEAALPAWCFRLAPQVVFHLGYTVPRLPLKAPSVLLVPDAGPLETGPLRMSLHADRNRQALLRQVPRARRLVVSTEFTRKRLQALLGLAPDSIDCIPPFGAYARNWSQPGAEDAVIAQTFPQGFLLCVGNIEPRKNHEGLLRGYARALARHADLPPLVLVGHEAWDGGRARALAVELGLAEHVVWQGHVDDAWLGAYFRCATLFVTASLYEGFGMPLFEAMALGKACIYHIGTAQDDYARDAAWAVDTQNPEALGEALGGLAKNPDLRHAYEDRARLAASLALAFDQVAALSKTLQAALNAPLDDPKARA